MSFFTGGGGTTAPRDPTVKIGDPSRTGNIGGYDAGGATGAGRHRPPGAPIIGTAITREELAAQQEAAKTPAPPPSTAAAASLAQGGAKSAAERQRKRAAAGDIKVAGAGKAGPLANLTPQTLIGS